jgi:hypothetical protein
MLKAAAGTAVLGATHEGASGLCGLVAGERRTIPAVQHGPDLVPARSTASARTALAHDLGQRRRSGLDEPGDMAVGHSRALADDHARVTSVDSLYLILKLIFK